MGRSLRQKDRANVFCAGSISCAESYAAFFAGGLAVDRRNGNIPKAELEIPASGDVFL